jgi:hypothetical protein
MNYFKKSILTGLFALLISLSAIAQVGIGTATPATSAQLDVTSTTKGFLPPRMTYAQVQAISTPANGLLVWCTDCGTSGQMLSYATNSWVAFTSTSVSIPVSITTNTVTSTTNTTAALSGTVTPTTNVSPTSGTGFVYSTSSTSSLIYLGGTSSSTTSSSYSSSTGNFSASLTGLTRNTTYYARAYVYLTSSMSYSYGNTISFTTADASTSTPTVSTTAASTDPSCSNSTANLAGSVTSDGNATITATGFQYSTNSNFSGALTEMTGTASTFSTTLRSLTANQPYYVRAYATNTVGTSYGETLFFTTTNPTLPGVTTQWANHMPTPSSISMSGRLSCGGGSAITSIGFQYSTTNDNFTTGASTVTSTLSPSTTDFYGTITAPASGTYYIRAFATNGTGTQYGSTISTTVAPRTPLTGSNGNSDYGSTDNQRGGSISPLNNSTSLLSENADKNLIAVSRKKKMLASSVNSASPPESLY